MYERERNRDRDRERERRNGIRTVFWEVQGSPVRTLVSSPVRWGLGRGNLAFSFSFLCKESEEPEPEDGGRERKRSILCLLRGWEALIPKGTSTGTRDGVRPDQGKSRAAGQLEGVVLVTQSAATTSQPLPALWL